LGVGIQDPVNEENCIGRQTFSIREIQKEWALSCNALTVAIEEYEMDVHGGREKSLLASIVGLTTRYFLLPSHLSRFSDRREYESRKQINNVSLPEPSTGRATTVAKQIEYGNMASSIPHTVSKAVNYVSPPPELNPKPAKRYKFRNMLTRDGKVVGNEEVRKLVDTSGRRKEIELMDFSQTGSEGQDSEYHSTELERFSGTWGKSTTRSEGSELVTLEAPMKLFQPPQLIDLSLTEETGKLASLSKPVNGGTSEDSQLLDLSHPSVTIAHFSASTSIKTDRPQKETRMVAPEVSVADWFSGFVLDNSTKQQSPTASPFPDTLDVSTVPSTPSIQSASTTPTLSTAVRNTAVSPPLPPVIAEKLLDLDGSTAESGIMGDLVGLSTPFTPTPTSLGDLAGLEFQFSSPPKGDVADDLLAEPINPIVEVTPEVAAKPVVVAVKDPPEEAIVFQGRCHTRRSTPSQIKLVDPESADRAFRMFSQAIKKQHK